MYPRDAAQSFQRIVPDNTWKTNPCPNQLLGTWKYRNMGGELWDASREVANWNLADAYDSTWKTATIYKPKLTLSAQMVEPNKLFHPVNPITIQELPGGNYRDMGLNFAGCPEIRPVAGPTKASSCTATTYTGGRGPASGGLTIPLPWLIYKQDGDTRVIEKTFDTIKRWLALLDSHTQNDQLVRFGRIWDFLGDWL